ncbi:MAG: F0F1 ATP synthase subunit B [Pseudomonadota bacterium]|uniref:F0F1 ATP synthase subunit B n=1 Tax=Roseixanthobacter finlandensis TaxID=3119922 RepID=UPI003729B439
MTKTWKLTVAAALMGLALAAAPAVASDSAKPSSGPAGAAVAQQDHGASTGAHVAEVVGEAAHGGEHKGGFPPFNPATFGSQLAWLAVSFGALYLLMSRVTLPRIGRILEERHDRIARDLAEASQRRAESEAAQIAYEKALTEARGKANAIAGEARNRLNAETETNRKSLEAALTVKLEEAEARISSTKTDALSHVRGIAVDTAQTIVNTLVGTTPGQQDTESAVDQVLSRKAA